MKSTKQRLNQTGFKTLPLSLTEALQSQGHFLFLKIPRS